MNDLEQILQEIKQFSDQRDWHKFHNNKDLAIAISIEAAELNELFLWKTPQQSDQDFDKQQLADELADILTYAFMMAHKNQLDIKTIILDKLQKNAKKYPVEKSRGNAKKYTEL